MKHNITEDSKPQFQVNRAKVKESLSRSITGPEGSRRLMLLVL